MYTETPPKPACVPFSVAGRIRVAFPEVAGMPSFETNGATISYEIIRRPARRHPAIQVGRDGRVRVLIPPGFREKDVPDLLRAHERWIRRHVLDHPPVAHTFWNGDRFLYLGEPLVLSIRDETPTAGLPLYRDGTLTMAAWPDRGDVRKVLRDWFVQEAARDLIARVERWAPLVGRSPVELRVREYRTRWGYCRTDGLIAFNWRLIQAPPPVIDYVVVHELMHLRHPHHQPAFWKAVTSVFGDPGTARAWLREHDRALYW